MAIVSSVAQTLEFTLIRFIFMQIRYPIFILFLAFSLSISAQVTVKTASPKALKHYHKSDDHLDKQNFEGAKKSLLSAVDIEPEFIDAWIRLGDLCYFMQQMDCAIEYMEKAIEISDNYAAKPYYIGGMAAYMSNDFEKAAGFFETYLNLEPSVQAQKKIKPLLANCLFAMQAIKSPVPFKPINLGPTINTENHEYLPTLTADEQLLYFTKRVMELEDIYLVKKEGDVWGIAKNLGLPINTEQFGEGSQAISPDGKTLYYAADYGAYGQRGWDIYFSELKAGGWAKPEMMESPVNSKSYESQPCISADGKWLYFCSKRPGGYGDYDIWVSRLNDDCSWGEPQNLGPEINTAGHEQVAFIHPDNQTLYFGSNGHPGMGGTDLYLVRKQTDGTWGKAQNLGYPINTTANEGSIFVTTDGNEGYFASDVMGGSGGFDLYYFELWDDIKPQPVTWVKAQIFDALTLDKLEANLELIDLQTGEIILSTKCRKSLKSDFLICLPAGHEYAINVEKPGYLFHSGYFSVLEKKNYDPQHVEIYMKRIEVGKSIVLQNIFFESGSFTLLPKSYPELDKVMEFLNKNPLVKVEVSGHTDNVGSETENQILSENRAKAVVEYLLGLGAAKDRISAKGYGESQPIQSNDTDAGRAANRRTEFKITHF